MKNKFFKWLPLGITITILCGLAFVLPQQILRMNANDPQLEIVTELGKAITDTENPSDFNQAQKSDVTSSLSSFWMVVDSEGKTVASNGLFGTQVPSLPKGVLDRAKKTGENRITWQPQKNLRLAMVIRPYAGKTKGFVAAGKSLAEVEKRTNNLLIISVLAWIIAIAGSLLASLFAPATKAHHAENS